MRKECRNLCLAPLGIRHFAVVRPCQERFRRVHFFQRPVQCLRETLGGVPLCKQMEEDNRFRKEGNMRSKMRHLPELPNRLEKRERETCLVRCVLPGEMKRASKSSRIYHDAGNATLFMRNYHRDSLSVYLVQQETARYARQIHFRPHLVAVDNARLTTSFLHEANQVL